MKISTNQIDQLEMLSDADLDGVLGGEIGPVTPTIICPVGQTYDTGAGKCVATKQQFNYVSNED